MPCEIVLNCLPVTIAQERACQPHPRPSQQDRRSGSRKGPRDEDQAARRRRARPVGPPEVAAARGRRQHVPLRRRPWQGVGLGRHGRGQPHLAAARQGQPAILRHAVGHGAGQVPAADRRRGDQGQGGQRLGAAGASGGTGEEDEAVCIAGVEAAGLATG